MDINTIKQMSKEQKKRDSRKDHTWSRNSDLKLSTLCGYGRYCHEGSFKKHPNARTCGGRNCQCWCHKPYEIQRRIEKNQKAINFLASEIREHRIEIHNLMKELQVSINEQQELRQRQKL